MGEVVYTATVWKAFGYPLLALFFFTVLGFTGLGVGIFKSRDRTITRIMAGCAGIVLCMAAVAMALLAYRSYTGGSETIRARLNDKLVVTRRCGEGNRRTCTSYTLEMQTASMLYDVAVGEDAYNSVDINSCYDIAYYPNDGLFGPSENADVYRSIGSVTRITTAACP